LPPSTASLTAVRRALAQHFEPTSVATMARRMREAGELPPGRAGRGGVGSARIAVPEAAMLLIALSAVACGTPPLTAPAVARRLAAYKLVAIDRTGSSDPDPHRQFISGLDRVTFLDALVGEIDGCRGAHPRHRPASWRLSEEEIAMMQPARLVFMESSRARDRPMIVREVLLAGRIIADLAGCFPPLSLDLDNAALAVRLAGIVDPTLDPAQAHAHG
jgi:cytochrome P450